MLNLSALATQVDKVELHSLELMDYPTKGQLNIRESWLGSSAEKRSLPI